MISHHMVNLYCKDDISKIENYDQAISDTKNIWHLHHRLETHDKWGSLREEAIPSKVLRYLGLYYHRPVNELIFMTNKEHCELHGKILSEKAKAALLTHCKGKNNYWYGKNRSKENNPMYGKHHTEEAKKKIRKPVRCIETGMIFDSVTSAAGFFKCSKGSISSSIHKYKNKDSFNGYHFELV